jgi:MYXO-CTERM domain-containing protein
MTIYGKLATMMNLLTTRLTLSIVFAISWPVVAVAGPITFSFTNGGLGASAEFVRSGSDLIVTLTNTGTADALVPTDILTAVYFNVAGNPALTRTSALVPITSDVFEIGSGALETPGDRVVGGEWAFLITKGISSTGLGVFGPGDRFPGANLQGPDSPGGVQFGIIPAADNLLTGNGGISGSWMIRNAAIFRLAGFSAEPDAAISNVVFQYGTALDEPQYGGNIPEPSSFVLAAIGLVCLAAWRRRRR